MSTSRRQFILGTGAGLILPSYYDKVFTFFENTGEALIEIPKQTDIELIAIDRTGDGFELNWGDPWLEPPEMTVREFAVRYFGSEENFIELSEEEDIDFDAKMDFWDVVDTWSYRDSPNARAYRLLEDLDLGPDLTGEDAVGEIKFIEGASPGNDYLGVEAPSQLDISLLQKRLNDLDTGIRISLAEHDHV
jgi:hypothetical protein